MDPYPIVSTNERMKRALAVPLAGRRQVAAPRPDFGVCHFCEHAVREGQECPCRAKETR